MQSLEFRAMNTTVLMALDGQEPENDEGLRHTQAFVEECERRFSRFLPDSELSRLNASAGEWADASTELMELLILSKTYHQETGGLFDPSVLPDLKRAGYDVSMDVIREHGASSGSAVPRMAREPFAAVELDPEKGRARLPEGMEIDLGGIAKGWIVQEAAQRLELYGMAAAVSAGGDMYFSGMRTDGGTWMVEIEDPKNPAMATACLWMREGAVVTSSVMKRQWVQSGQNRHHIIDPRTGEPAWPDWQSVTVIAPHAPLAEAYAKALLIGGEKASSVLLLQQPLVGFIGIDRYGQMTASAKAKEWLHDCS